MKKYNRNHCSKAEQIEDRISELDDRNFEITQLEAKREKRLQNYKKEKKTLCALWNPQKGPMFRTIGIPGVKRGRKKQFI